ncbi:hypothetical protein V6N12_007901 [Hibiscus sabdariffa]|uniref:Uncharacterized protein n=1 Tax=Hibiscus sabdariffa TaxID=183260 RepID=A0ABR2A2H2_9ROSI
MTIADNLLGPPHGGDLVYPGGRSLDNIPVIPEGTIQDRSTSPPHLGDCRSIKKGRTEDLTDVGINDNEMVVSVEEALVGHFQAAVEPATTAAGVDSVNHKGGMKDSYARKVMCSMDNLGTSPTFLKDEVTILDEDIITDCNGKIPSIQFDPIFI